jgi:hypothetical protein
MTYNHFNNDEDEEGEFDRNIAGVKPASPMDRGDHTRGGQSRSSGQEGLSGHGWDEGEAVGHYVSPLFG